MTTRQAGNNNFSHAGYAGNEEIYGRFAMLLDAQSRVCDELEVLADSLPDAVDPQSCLRTAQQLLPTVKIGHEFEEAVLFPLIEAQSPYFNEIKGTIERLRFEHWGDEEFAEDVRHALKEYVRHREKANVDSLAWMLRGFFEGMRRHIAFDREYLLPILRTFSGPLR